MLPLELLDRWFVLRADVAMSWQAGGPFKPCFGLRWEVPAFMRGKRPKRPKLLLVTNDISANRPLPRLCGVAQAF